ncbi:MAG: amino acid permease, partial [Planctomycetes bacterium]|nr:amino acid permease [Planctomycetota bacterium]
VVAKDVFGSVSGPWVGMAAWTLGGVLSFIGALCYAELATTYPRMGGDYVYLSRAFGRPVGFLFGWAQLAVILTGSIGAMAYAFGNYSYGLWSDSLGDYGKTDCIVVFAVSSVIALSLLNLLGVSFGKRMQNVLSVVKIAGLLAIIIAGIGWGGSEPIEPSQVPAKTSFGFAMIMVLYAFGGWNDAAFVASEVRDRERNIPWALLYGIAGITVLYLLVNLAYLWGLGFDAVSKTTTPAADVLRQPFGENAGKAMSLIVMLSALGALNGLIFTGSRIFTALGREHSVFAALGLWNPRLGVPIWSILAQAAVSLILILAVGTIAGRDAIDSMLNYFHLDPLPGKQSFDGFKTLVAATAPVFWIFFLLTGISLFVLRWKDREIRRPFSVPLFPVVPLVFCATSVYMLYFSLTYAGGLSLLGFVPLALGVPLYFVSRRKPAAK